MRTVSKTLIFLFAVSTLYSCTKTKEKSPNDSPKVSVPEKVVVRTINLDSIKGRLIGKLYSGEAKTQIDANLGPPRMVTQASDLVFLVAYCEKGNVTLVIDNKEYIITNICLNKDLNCPKRDEIFLKKNKSEKLSETKEYKDFAKLKKSLIGKKYIYPFSTTLTDKYGSPETLLGTTNTFWIAYFPKGNFTITMDKNTDIIKEVFWGKL